MMLVPKQLIWRSLTSILMFVCSLEAQTLRKVATIELPGPKGERFDYLTMDDEDHWLDAHPESFQLEKNSPRIYVNLPKSRKIVVVDREKRTILATWGTGMAFANYPMTLNEKDHRLFVVTRMPARLLVFNTDNGTTVQKLSAIGDCDDVF